MFLDPFRFKTALFVSLLVSCMDDDLQFRATVVTMWRRNELKLKVCSSEIKS